MISYAQCWEDADVLLEALDVRPGQHCLSIASAGDNTLALLARAPAQVIAVDCNPAQIACLELRVAAYRALAHGEVLELIGSLASRRRAALYRRCRSLLGAQARAFWDARPDDIDLGVGAAGRLERYLALFRDRVLPAIHPRRRVERLLRGGTRTEREEFYDREWDTWSWRALFRVFFSRAFMALAGRERSHFRYVDGSIAAHLLARVRHACTALDPADNPYLHWILTGAHGAARPFALRAENFGTIRAHIERLQWHCLRLEELLARLHPDSLDRCNLSDVFEYMPPEQHEAALRALRRVCRPGARLAYWNLLVPRRRPESLATRLAPLVSAAAHLHARDKAFFYGSFVLEEAV
ncbi:MAG: BtaA family protein [Betaproteobacteria bacterium]|nr:BtaA family protein [Betaproteobacteria bacterium]